MTRAIIYDDYLHSMGGGERSALAYATAMRDLGFGVLVASTSQCPARQVLEKAFGINLNSIRIAQCCSVAEAAALGGGDVSVWVNHTHLSAVPNLGRLGIYSMMFPFPPSVGSSPVGNLSALRTYQYICCNSRFTESHLRRVLPAHPGIRTVYPPLAGRHQRTAVRLLSARGPALLSRKGRQIISVGRFNPRPHSKHQAAIIRTFLRAQANCRGLRDWALFVVGQPNSGEAATECLTECQRLAEGSEGAVTVLAAAHFDTLSDLLDRSFGFVHAAGLDESDPACCEHLGMAILEAMAHGCIPLVVGRGGILELLRANESGWLYENEDELERGFFEYVKLYESGAGLPLQLAAVRSAKELSYGSFVEKLRNLVNADGTGMSPVPAATIRTIPVRDEPPSCPHKVWDQLSNLGVRFSLPMLHFNVESALEFLDPEGVIREFLPPAGSSALCLASGGGQQSAALGVLGYRVIVFDLSMPQLIQDRLAASHYGSPVWTVQGDMRRPLPFQDGVFDTVWQAWSINQTADPDHVVREVARMLKVGGYYCLQFCNPFFFNVDIGDWNGNGYLLKETYVEGAHSKVLQWGFEGRDGAMHIAEAPHEWRHTLGRLVRVLADAGFLIHRLWEDCGADGAFPPATWDHLKRIAPSPLSIWARRRPSGR